MNQKFSISSSSSKVKFVSGFVSNFSFTNTPRLCDVYLIFRKHKMQEKVFVLFFSFNAKNKLKRKMLKCWHVTVKVRRRRHEEGNAAVVSVEMRFFVQTLGLKI